jgi:signal transduction histidine kinase
MRRFPRARPPRSTPCSAGWTAIPGYADLLTDPAVALEDRVSHVAILRRNGEHLLELINDVLDLSKIEAGKCSLEMRRCSVAAIVADVASMMRLRAEQRHNSLSVEYAGEFPETILTDGARLRQAVVNLVGNAVKFTENGRVRIVTSFLPAWREGRSAVRIEVADTGVGIRDEAMRRLFQPFCQADDSTSRKFEGTGLGLAISRHIAELLGGELTAHSVFGHGSSFVLTVPTGDLQGIPMLHRPAEAIRDSLREARTPGAKSLEGVDRVSRIVRSMKEFSHPGSGENQAVDLNQVIESTLTVSRGEWKYVAEVVTDLDPCLPPVTCLPGDIHQVLLNVIVNAAHAVEAKLGSGSDQKGRITIRTRQDGDWVRIDVEDTGTGIPEAVRGMVFSPFFTTKRVGKGTGQGLAIARAIVVQRHGGTITFDTECGRGTVFTIRIPVGPKAGCGPRGEGEAASAAGR